MSDGHGLTWAAEPVGTDRIYDRLDRLAHERDQIQDLLDANERERTELVGRWNGNAAEANRLTRKLKFGQGIANDEEEEEA